MGSLAIPEGNEILTRNEAAAAYEAGLGLILSALAMWRDHWAIWVAAMIAFAVAGVLYVVMSDD